MKSIIPKHRTKNRFKLKKGNQTGIVLLSSKISEENWIEKYTVSFDKINRIERILVHEVIIKEYISDTDYFERLILNIQSTELKTRVFASEILCDFIEFIPTGFNLKMLQKGIEIVVQQLQKETNIDVEQKLAESIFEFIWSEQMSPRETKDLLIRLTKIESTKIYGYIDDEEYWKIPEVKSYIEKMKSTIMK